MPALNQKVMFVIKRVGEIVVALLRDMRAGQMDLRAMSLVYSTLLSLVPLLALSFAVLKGFGVHNQLEPLLLELLAPLGPEGAAITQQILEFVGNIRVGVLGAVGLGVLVYTVVSLIQKIVAALEFTWGGRRAGRARRIVDYLVILLTGPLLVFAIAGAVSGAVESSVVQSLLNNEWLAALYAELIRWLPLSILIAVLSFMYWFVPEEKVSPLAALTGGVVSGALWKLTGWGFGAFVVGSGSYTAVYSAFAALMFFIIWLYLNWLILLIGARIAFYIQHPEMLRADIVDQSWLPALIEKVGLRVMVEVGRAFRDGNEPPTATQLRRQLQVEADGLGKVLEHLMKGGLLREDKDGGYLPALPLSSIQIMAVLNAVRGEQPEQSGLLVDGLQGRMKDSLAQQWGSYTLDDLLAEDASSSVNPP